MGQNERAYDPPVVVDRLTRLPARSGELPLPGSPAAPLQGCIEVEGRYSNYDVHIQVPPAWLDVTLRVVLETGSIQQVLAIKAIADLPLYYDSQIVQGGANPPTAAFGALAFSIRGRQCDKLRLEAYHTNIDHPLGKFRVQAWGSDGFYGDQSTVPPVQPFADITKQINATQLLTGAAFQAFDWRNAQGIVAPAENPTGGRIAITRLSLSHTEEVPVLYTVTSNSEGAGAVVKGQFLVHPGAHYVEELTYQLRGIPNGNWGIAASVFSGGATHALNATGFYE